MERAHLVSTLVVAGFGIFTFAFGVWAILDTSSFYNNVADFPPYNRHFLHDLGAFQMGLGAALLFALLWRGDAILAALGGGAVGGTAHWIVHVTDEEFGGRDSDPYTLGIIAAILVAAFVMRLLAVQKESTP
jgi:hypothetical protein